MNAAGNALHADYLKQEVPHSTMIDAFGRPLTPPQAARLIGVRKSKVIAWIRSGELHAINTATNPFGQPRWKIPLPNWEAFLAGRSNSKPAPKPVRRKQSDVIHFYRGKASCERK